MTIILPTGESISERELFSSRPSVTLRCPRCDGSGELTKSYWLAHSVDHVADGAISAVVVGTAMIFEAVREAKDLAVRSNRHISFTFLGRTVVVGPEDDPNQVGRRWWIAEYGETPEQTAERR